MSIFGEKDEIIDFLDVCLEHYAPQDGALLRWIYIDGHSIREYAEMNGVSRTYIMKESKRILEMTARFFNTKFAS